MPPSRSVHISFLIPTYEVSDHDLNLLDFRCGEQRGSRLCYPYAVTCSCSYLAKRNSSNNTQRGVREICLSRKSTTHSLSLVKFCHHQCKSSEILCFDWETTYRGRSPSHLQQLLSPALTCRSSGESLAITMADSAGQNKAEAFPFKALTTSSSGSVSDT